MRLSDLVREQAPDLPGDPAARHRSMPAHALSLQGEEHAATSLPAHTSPGSEWYVSAQQEMAKVGASVRNTGAVAVDPCVSLAADLVTRLQAGDDLIQCVMAGASVDYQTANALHVAIISVKIGMGLQYAAPALERLAIAGLLHDVGMWLVEPALLEKSGSLNEDERARIHAHPEEGRRMVSALGESYGWLATTIAQEHERWDGTGYPCRLKGGDITESAQIIGLADLFDALISPRPYHARVVPHLALRGLLVQHKPSFQSRLLKTLVDQLSLYPVGTAVRLNDGHIGVVSKINPRYPLRPVLLVRGSQGGLTGGATAPLDLTRETSMHIVEVLPAPQAA